MHLPNPDRAVVELAKLEHYCLSPEHPDGKHKARVFRAALGLRQGDAGWLRTRLLEAVSAADARLQQETAFGTHYMIDFQLRTFAGQAIVRSGWIIRHGEDFPRLTTCFVLKS
jgi:hypothetical protein